jgi:hypothetical protein
VSVHWISLVLGAAVILYLDGSNWFLGDEFEFFGRMQPGASLSLLVPHNGHWSTVPLLLTLALYKAFGLRAFLPYVLMDLIVHLAVCHLLWRWMRRVGADPWVATALAAVFVVVGGGVEEVWSWFQFSFSLPLALGLVGARLVDHQRRGARRDIATWPILVMALMCSGVGLLTVALTAVVALLRRGWGAGIRVASLPAAAYVVWFASVGRHYLAVQQGPAWEHLLLFEYVWNGMTSAVGDTVGWGAVGPVLLVALAVWVLSRVGTFRNTSAFALAAALTALLYYLLLGAYRAPAGVWEATLTRYGYVGVALLLPAVALALTQVAGRGVMARSIVLSACALATVGSLASWVSFLQIWNPITVTTRGQVLAAARLVAGGSTLAVDGGAQVEPVHSGNLTVDMLRSMIRTRSIPTDAPVSPIDMLGAELFLQTSVDPDPLVGGSAPSIDPASLPLVTSIGTGCVTAGSATQGAHLDLDFANPGAVSMVAEAGGTLALQLARLTDTSVTSPAMNYASLPAGDPVFLNVSAHDVAAALALPPGLVTLCGLRAP